MLTMLTVTVPGRPTIALLISREGEALWVSRSTDAPIFLFQENEKETILGRLELLEAQHRACGCSSKTSSWSTKGKCSHCSLVNQWAVTALSRRLLRFTYDDFGKIFVQGRGKHAAIYLDSKRLDTGNDDWSGEIEIHMGDTLCLAPAQVENSKALHLKIVEANQMNMSRDDPIHKGDHLGLTNPQDMEGGLGIVTSDAKNHRCMLASSGASKRKVPGSTTESNEVKLFLVPLGHDMSSVRRKLLAHKAKNLGALVVHDVFESSHILVSQQVSFLREVSEALKLNEGDLRLYIEQVCAKIPIRLRSDMCEQSSRVFFCNCRMTFLVCFQHGLNRPSKRSF